MILLIMSTLPWRILIYYLILNHQLHPPQQNMVPPLQESYTHLSNWSLKNGWYVNFSFCTSQNTSSIAKQQQKRTRTIEYDTGQGSLPYSNLQSKIKWNAQMTKTLWPSKQDTRYKNFIFAKLQVQKIFLEDNHWFSKSIITVYLSTKAKTVGDEN